MKLVTLLTIVFLCFPFSSPAEIFVTPDIYFPPEAPLVEEEETDTDIELQQNSPQITNTNANHHSTVDREVREPNELKKIEENIKYSQPYEPNPIAEAAFRRAEELKSYKKIIDPYEDFTKRKNLRRIGFDELHSIWTHIYWVTRNNQPYCCEPKEGQLHFDCDDYAAFTSAAFLAMGYAAGSLSLGHKDDDAGHAMAWVMGVNEKNPNQSVVYFLEPTIKKNKPTIYGFRWVVRAKDPLEVFKVMESYNRTQQMAKDRNFPDNWGTESTTHIYNNGKWKFPRELQKFQLSVVRPLLATISDRNSEDESDASYFVFERKAHSESEEPILYWMGKGSKQHCPSAFSHLLPFEHKTHYEILTEKIFPKNKIGVPIVDISCNAKIVCLKGKQFVEKEKTFSMSLVLPRPVAVENDNPEGEKESPWRSIATQMYYERARAYCADLGYNNYGVLSGGVQCQIGAKKK